MPADEDVQRAIDGELWLLQPHVRTSAAGFEALLHPEFFEFGAARSGGRRGPGGASTSTRAP